MTPRAAVGVVMLMATTGGCAYWKARPTGDVAPATWGAAAAPAPDVTVPAAVQLDVTSPVAAQPRQVDVEQRLRNLKNLHRQGVIGNAEYRERREELLRQTFE